MDKDYLEKNRLTPISMTFLGNTVSRFIDKDIQQQAYDRGELDLLNNNLKRAISVDFLLPTLTYLINRKLTVVADVSGMSDRSLLDALYTKRADLDKLLSQTYDEIDAYLFLYAGDDAYRRILESEYIYRSGAIDPRIRKIAGVYYDHCSKLDKDQILFGTIPKELIEKDTFIPHFVKEIIDNQ